VTYTGTEEEFPMYKQLTILAFACAFAVGCRDTSTTPPTTGNDMAGTTTTGGDMAGTTTTGGDMAGTTKTFVKTSIVSMRGGKPGTFELDNVIVLGVTGSAAKPSIYVRDAGAPADFSAMQIKCAATTAHPCTVPSLIKAATLGQSVTIQGDYIKSTGFEEFYIDGSATAFVAGAAGSAPAAVDVAITDITRNASTPAKWFQYVNVTSPGTLAVYDLSPVELVYSGATKCPYQLGFGLIASGTSGVTAAAACGASNAQPAGVATPNAAEILIATDFYTTYKQGSDCVCVATQPTNMDTQITPTMTATALKGILVSASVYMSSPAVNYQYIAPVLPADLVLQ
jgi:hypothetical protein